MGNLHKPVLVQEIREIMKFQAGKCYLDCTIGTGGLAYYILSDSSPTGKLIGLDCDSEALNIAKRGLSQFGDRVVLVYGNFRDLHDVLNKFGIREVDGVVFDLGVSSLQLDTPQRGFSFKNDGPLDMRMDRQLKENAQDLLKKLNWKQLREVFEKYGEEKYAQKIAKAIVKYRGFEEITTTGQLASLIAKTVPKQSARFHIHPATKVFQAIRIAVNDELNSLKSALPSAVSVIRQGGKLAILSFHSLEDRIVKAYFQAVEKGCICPPDFPKCNCGRKPVLRILTKKAIRPGPHEKKTNPRCRSAKLRAAEKLASVEDRQVEQ